MILMKSSPAVKKASADIRADVLTTFEVCSSGLVSVSELLLFRLSFRVFPQQSLVFRNTELA